MTDVTCRTFIESLDDLLEGRLGPADRQAAQEHLGSCRECRDLRSLVVDASAPVAPPADLLGAVLARTSGPACGSARERLCDHVDRLLAPPDEDLVRMHLDVCGECAGLAATLARLATDLPPLAEMEPGARFVPDVLVRTSRRPALSDAWTARFAGVWRRLAYRPRIALEGAYAGAIILVMLFGTANAPFADVPRRGIALVRSAQESLPAGAAVEEVPRIRTEVVSRWTRTKAEITNRARDLTGGLRRGSAAIGESLKKDLGTVWNMLASGESNGMNGTAPANEEDKGE